ncbi:MAG: hypothetical protein LUG13_08955 [Oscillospiraceae bacterium]|nr:hypothetical protein [Oscillospiraceae bacterium]
MENPILQHLRGRLGVREPNVMWLLTLFSLWDLNRYPLEVWNDALSDVLGKRVRCPSFGTLSGYLQRTVLGER